MTRPEPNRSLAGRGALRPEALRAAAWAGLLASVVISLTALVPVRGPSPAGATSPTFAYAGGTRMAADPAGGYWTTSPGGRVHGHDGAPSYGSLSRGVSRWPVVGMAATTDGAGYWLVASDGGVFAFGDARFYGSTTHVPLNQPVVGMAATTDGAGYWLVASDGGVFAFGDAPFSGSAIPLSPTRPVVAMAPTPDANGYWLVTSNGGVYSFGSAPDDGSLSATHVHRRIVAMAPTADGDGYWLAALNGDVYQYGDASDFGSLGARGVRVAGLMVSSRQPGYTLVESNGRTAYRGPDISDTGPSSSTTTTSTSPTAPLGTSTTTQPLLGSTPGSLSSVLGVYGGPGYPTSVADFATLMGGRTTYAMDFLDPSSWTKIEDPSWFLSRWAGTGYRMIWGVPMLPNTWSYSLSDEAAGAYDGYFTTLSQNLIAGGQGSSIIRLGWEFNGGWFPWHAGGQAANFVGAFRHIVTAMRSVPGANYTFEWNPDIGDLGVGDLAQYYPGDTYVDYVGLDVYDIDWGNYSGADSEFAALQTEPYGLNWLASFGAAHAKPLVFPEWGLGWGTCSGSGQAISTNNVQGCGGDDPTFIDDMANWFATHDVAEATYWDYGSSTVDGCLAACAPITTGDGVTTPTSGNPLTARELVNDFG